MIISRDINRPIILASASPRRREILSKMGAAFTVAPSGVIDEDAFLDLNDLDGSLQRLARAKAENAADENPSAVVIGADTTVVLYRGGRAGVCGGGDGAAAVVKILGKPRDRDDAAEMLRELSGRCHTVISAVALRCAEINFCESLAVHTEVYFRELGEDEIAHYLSFPEYEDKAGSYAVQGGAMTFINKIEGCYYNVMGLPVTATIELFNAFLRKDRSDVEQ